MFTYDADMEWDLNSPWYRPTRINHVIDGADHGWRTGSANSPTTALIPSGPWSTSAPVPRLEFVLAVEPVPGKYPECVLPVTGPTANSTPSTNPRVPPTQPALKNSPRLSLPLTDILVNEADGAMYFTVGGRRVQSGLYRHLRWQ